ncbi:hypothetical protein F4604DRAFT_1675544 [Suillus subluteus]|nr:hypothetical protein F4604DRAFT_1675544 [Suillus subluteus]
MAPNGATPPPSSLPTTTAKTTRRTTATKSLFTASKTLEEHISGSGTRTDITNIPSARKILITHGLVLPTTGSALKQLAAAVFELSLSTNTGATHSEPLRAIAILMNDIDQALDTDHLIDKICALMGGPIATLDEKIKTLEQFTEKHVTALDEAVTKRHPGSDGPRSYASVTKAGIPAPLNKILAHSDAQARQILIDRRSVFASNTLKDLSESQLVAKATLALELMKEAGHATPDKISILSARKLPHGGIIYEMESATSAEWIATPANRSAFLEHFGPEVIVKDRAYHIIVENVPISFNPLAASSIADIEKKGGLKHNTISRI